MMKKTVFVASFLMAITLLSPITYAKQSNNDSTQSSMRYYTLTPNIITNYVMNDSRLGYIRLQVDLMLTDSNQLVNIEHHAPLIRDCIISIISQQSAQQIKSLAGRENIRQLSKQKINQLLLVETGHTAINELLFTKYLYQ
ncbi:flagellar basal body-associated FliL family protein [Photobacterium iliopiscarium]|uniref:flagellar basal body-associated FliL family protein n=2 Tax=Photobacterium iliopiscarium TaxID=56192 RepID=UPI000D163A5F|nr:flagellar basal body-associated FliL family protein [Photobacterium iliopiscarium]MCD9466114.1 flagellar basal body-associated protein FliL [Photobacterium iliopiscarium]MCD9485708.1 flagellar basal body-associated protein FliL [Photobacterium iliopiscarium]MCF2242405.1 flagellar basal body-associated protein FliL [Photobacterium iliopiscarium]PST99099.1 flagellar basal body-associated protein FliL [Photobacterium iliopiscarium]PSV81779.1 flagellar basal body-associated protein FliL [Photob